ncbi:hypothetical protein [Streptomyces sp. NPDC058572]|uniref:hypothetical protein n=1 Tax=Streptomyces sp. NPDC058572 TaxID=3346546 RepID=UPI00365B4BC8
MIDATYRAEVYGGDAETVVYLGGLDVRNPRRALRWLRQQAHRFADALDPDPFAEWVPPQALQPVMHAERNAPAELRFWAEDNEHQGDALRQLNAGRTFEFVADDDTCWYALTAHPLGVLAPAPLPAVLAHA